MRLERRDAIWFGIGLAVGLVLLAGIRLMLEPAVPSIGVRMEAAGTLPLWRRLLIIYVAAVSEEVLFRLLLMSALAGILARLRRHPERVPTTSSLWTANLGAALLFAVVHLPAWGSIAALGPALAATVVALNAFGGVVLGHVFATRGTTTSPARRCSCGSATAVDSAGSCRSLRRVRQLASLNAHATLGFEPTLRVQLFRRRLR